MSSGDGESDTARATRDQSTSTRLYILGVGGPEDESGIGRPELFRWRCALVERPNEPAIALAFTTMPLLMAFTRALNQRQPFTVPTEAQDTGGQPLAPAQGVVVAVDPTAEEIGSWLAAGAQIVERAVPEWER